VGGLILPTLLDAGRRQFPQNPRFHLWSAELEMRRGPWFCHRGKATGHFRKVIELVGAHPSTAASGPYQDLVDAARRGLSLLNAETGLAMPWLDDEVDEDDDEFRDDGFDNDEFDNGRFEDEDDDDQSGRAPFGRGSSRRPQRSARQKSPRHGTLFVDMNDDADSPEDGGGSGPHLGGKSGDGALPDGLPEGSMRTIEEVFPSLAGKLRKLLELGGGASLVGLMRALEGDDETEPPRRPRQSR